MTTEEEEQGDKFVKFLAGWYIGASRMVKTVLHTWRVTGTSKTYLVNWSLNINDILCQVKC